MFLCRDVPQLPPRKSSRKIKSFESESQSKRRPNLPSRPPPNSLTLNKLRKPPKLPPRSQTYNQPHSSPTVQNSKSIKAPSKPPKKSALEVAKKVRRKSSGDMVD